MKAIPLLLVILLLVLSTTLHAQPTQPAVLPPPDMPVPPAPPDAADRHTMKISSVEPVSPGIYRVGEIIINKTEKSVSFPAEVNMDKGLLEYVLVRTGGKTHESLLRTRIEPYNIQVACLLLGLEPTKTPLAFQGSPETPKGTDVAVSITLKDGKVISPESWMTKIVNGKNESIPELSWVYTGSVIFGGRFAAQLDGSIIAVFHDPAAMIDNASTGGESDKIWFVNEKTVPPVGTPVTVSIKVAR